MVQGRADIPELSAIEVALELGQCKHTSTREKGPCQETHEPRVMLGGRTGSLSVQPKISTSRFAWLSHGGIRKMRMMREGCGIYSQHSHQAEGHGNLLFRTPLIHGGCRLKKPLCPFDKELPACNKSHRDFS